GLDFQGTPVEVQCRGIDSLEIEQIVNHSIEPFCGPTDNVRCLRDLFVLGLAAVEKLSLHGNHADRLTKIMSNDGGPLLAHAFERRELCDVIEDPDGASHATLVATYRRCADQRKDDAAIETLEQVFLACGEALPS